MEAGEIGRKIGEWLFILVSTLALGAFAALLFLWPVWIFLIAAYVILKLAG